MTAEEIRDDPLWQPLDVFKAARAAKAICEGDDLRAAYESVAGEVIAPLTGDAYVRTKHQPAARGGGLKDRWAAAKGFNGFNTFLSLAEKSSDQLPPGVAPLVSQIKLFTLDGLPEDFIPRSETPEHDAMMEESIDNFFLPFPVVAVQDGAGCVILFDFEENARGLAAPRGFVDISPVLIDALDGASAKSQAMVDHHHEKAKKAGVSADTACITFGVVEDFRVENKTPDLPEGGWSLKGKVVRVVVASKRELIWDWSKAADHYLGDNSKDSREFSTSILNNVMSAYEEVMYINQPSHFILEEIHEKLHERFQRKFGGKKKKKRYPRSTERPTYTVLPPKKIRHKMGLPPITHDTNGKKAPHWRRAHTRVLRSDRYRQKGKTIFVKACWIGPSEAKVGGKHYKVLLDR